MAEERLGSVHLEWIARLQESYPPEFRVSGEKLAQKLDLLERTPPFLSWLLSEGGQPTAYVIAFPASSRIDSSIEETVVSIDDLLIEPGRPHDLFRLLRLLNESMMEADLQQLAIETTCRRGAYEIMTGHPLVVERLGYELVAEHRFWSPDLGEELTWLRYHPIRDSEISIADSITWSQDLQDEVRLRAR